MAAHVPAVAVAVRNLYRDIYAAGIGLVWVVGRILYVHGYAKATEKRGLGFFIQAIATTVLWAGSLGTVVWRIVHV